MSLTYLTTSIIGFLSILLGAYLLIFCYKTAKEKSRNPYLWVALTILFGIFAAIALILLPSKKNLTKDPIKETPGPSSSLHNESAASLDSEENFEIPRAPRLSGSKSLSWYFVDQKDNDAIKGPFSLNNLRKHIHEENLDSSTYIWCEEFESWTQIQEFSNSSLLMDKDFIE